MSTFYPYRLRCGCGHVQQVELVAGIHITRLPWAREQILAGTFQVFPCPQCGTATAVTAPTVYTDFDLHQYVVVETRAHGPWPGSRAAHERIFENSFANGPPIASEMGVMFRKRCVFGFPALREKLVIWDANLDDLVVEAVKADLAGRVGSDVSTSVFRLAGVLPGGHLSFARFDTGRAPATMPAVGVDGGPELRSDVASPVDFETVLAPDYRSRLERRAAIVDEFPWLGDDWLVALHDGLVMRPAGAARR